MYTHIYIYIYIYSHTHTDLQQFAISRSTVGRASFSCIATHTPEVLPACMLWRPLTCSEVRPIVKKRHMKETYARKICKRDACHGVLWLALRCAWLSKRDVWKSSLKKTYERWMKYERDLQKRPIEKDLSSRGGGLGSSTIFKKFHETYAPS